MDQTKLFNFAFCLTLRSKILKNRRILFSWWSSSIVWPNFLEGRLLGLRFANRLFFFISGNMIHLWLLFTSLSFLASLIKEFISRKWLGRRINKKCILICHDVWNHFISNGLDEEHISCAKHERWESVKFHFDQVYNVKEAWIKREFQR